MNLRERLRERLKPRFKEAFRLRAMHNAFAGVRGRQEKSLGQAGDMMARKRRLREVREKCIEDESLLSRAAENLASAGFRVHFAATAEEAVKLVLDELDGEKRVVKSKSNVSKEIALTEALCEAGVEVIETDIGDRLIQLTGEKPCHPTMPAIHLSSPEIAHTLSRYFGRELPPDPAALTELIRQEVSEAIERSQIGITGANAIAAEEGMVALWHNEGNIWKVMMRPGKHIILAGIDKIYPNLDEVINLSRVQTFYGTGQVAPTFINIIGGPSRTADIESHLIMGIHGPRQVSIIFVDNGRRELRQSEFRDLLYCINCGTCLLECPAYAVHGHRFGFAGEGGARGAVKGALTGHEVRTSLELCLSCGRCRKACPMEIDTPEMVRKLRESGRAEALWNFINSHLRWAGRLIYLESLLLLAGLLAFDREIS